MVRIRDSFLCVHGISLNPSLIRKAKLEDLETGLALPIFLGIVCYSFQFLHSTSIHKLQRDFPLGYILEVFDDPISDITVQDV
jgi:hypothetical protein